MQTNLQTQLYALINTSADLTNYKITILSLELLSVLIGFFISTALSTIPAQKGDWSIVAAGIIIGNQEIISKINYQNRTSFRRKIHLVLKIFLKYCNSIKIGILYGLFIDAFKLGS